MRIRAERVQSGLVVFREWSRDHDYFFRFFLRARASGGGESKCISFPKFKRSWEKQG